MKFYYISDLHLEKARHTVPTFIGRARPLFLAGDLGNPRTPKYESFLGQVAENWAHVFIVAGNHEYGGLRHEEQFAEMDARIDSLAAKIGNITFLNQKVIQYQDSWIVGATLWTRTDSLKGARINTENARHAADRAWLATTLARPEMADRKVVVMTHHLPSYKLVTPKFARHPRLFRWASDSDDLITPPIRAWICGHSHICNQTWIGGVPIYINAATGKLEKAIIK